MKKTLIIIAIVLAITVTSAVVWALSPRKNLKPSEYNIGTTYELAQKDNKPLIVLFYADWCTYCMRFMPKCKIIADVYKDKYNFVMINVDDKTYEKLITDYALGGFPTVYITDPKLDNRVLISNTIYGDLGKLRIEFDRYLRIRSLIPAEKLK